MTDTTNAEVVDFPGTPSGESEPGTVALPGPAEVEAEVVEGVVVDDAAPVVQSVVLRPVQVVRIVVQHEHTQDGRAASRVRPAGRCRGGQAVVGLAHHVPLRAVHARGRGQRQP